MFGKETELTTHRHVNVQTPLYHSLPESEKMAFHLTQMKTTLWGTEVSSKIQDQFLIKCIFSILSAQHESLTHWKYEKKYSLHSLSL